MRLAPICLTAALTIGCALAPSPSQARIVRLTVTKVEPAFAGQTFGNTGPYELVTAEAHGEVDPKSPANAIIQDIALAPRNARGMVEYISDITILRPTDPARSNHVLLFNVVNRGNKGALSLFNADVPANPTANNAVKIAGDGWLQRQGYTIIWFGWQGDVLPGNNRLTISVPIAHNPDGTAITGTVRSEFVVSAPATTLPLSEGWFTTTIHAAYPTVSTDNQTKQPDGFLPDPDGARATECAAHTDRQHRLAISAPAKTANQTTTPSACKPDFNLVISTNCSIAPRTHWFSAWGSRRRAIWARS